MSTAHIPSHEGDPVPSGEAFRRLVRELSLPHPDRARLARELASDVHELAQELERRGTPPDQARERAETMLLPRGPSLAALERVHRPLYARLTAGLPPGRLRRWERAALGVVGAAGLGVALAAMAQGDLLGSPSASGFLVPVLVLGVASVAAALAKAFQLFVKRDHAPARLRTGILIAPTLGAVSVCVAGVGFLVDLFRLAVAMESSPAEPGRLVLEFVSGAAALLAAGLVLTLLAGLLWYFSAQWLARVEQVEREFGPPSRGHSSFETET